MEKKLLTLILFYVVVCLLMFFFTQKKNKSKQIKNLPPNFQQMLDIGDDNGDEKKAKPVYKPELDDETLEIWGRIQTFDIS